MLSINFVVFNRLFLYQTMIPNIKTNLYLICILIKILPTVVVVSSILSIRMAFKLDLSIDCCTVLCY